jgi:predicted ester cyclase
MSEENKAIIRRFYAELDKHNFDIYDELCTDDYVSHFPGSPEAQDRSTRKQTSRSFYEAIPDIVHTLEDIIAEGDRVAARGIGRGTHTGPFGDLAPSGRKIEFTGMRFYRMVNGKIAEEWANLDLLGLQRQLGALPMPAESDRQGS